jgi:4-amino-4-deoxy-L-arabinose transferase-like glycosyltransferase
MLSGLEDKLRWRLKNEFEIYLLMILFMAWFYSNIQGAIKQDETIFAMQGYYFFKGNMTAEQFRPMGRYFFGLGQVMFGRNTFGTKFFIPLFSVFTIYLSYKVTRLFTNRLFGIFAAVILGIIPFYGDHSVSGLMDIIMAFFAILLFYFAMKYLRTEDLVKKQRLLPSSL